MSQFWLGIVYRGRILFEILLGTGFDSIFRQLNFLEVSMCYCRLGVSMFLKGSEVFRY